MFTASIFNLSGSTRGLRPVLYQVALECEVELNPDYKRRLVVVNKKIKGIQYYPGDFLYYSLIFSIVFTHERNPALLNASFSNSILYVFFKVRSHVLEFFPPQHLPHLLFNYISILPIIRS